MLNSLKFIFSLDISVWMPVRVVEQRLLLPSLLNFFSRGLRGGRVRLRIQKQLKRSQARATGEIGEICNYETAVGSPICSLQALDTSFLAVPLATSPFHSTSRELNFSLGGRGGKTAMRRRFKYL